MCSTRVVLYWQHLASTSGEDISQPVDSRPLLGLARIRARASGLAASVLAIGVLVAVLWAAYGRGYVGYDGMYSLVWGRDLLQGRLPDFNVPLAPTPHPLANTVGTLLSPLGDGALPALQALVIVSFAVLGWAAFRLGRQLFSVPVGVLFALILLTRDLLATEALQASVDIPFLALVLWAAALEAKVPRRGLPVLLLLDAAGLLRPEAWLLAGIYFVYMFPKAAKAQRTRLAAATAAAPLIWAALDLIVTGDALFSLHGTQDLAAQLQRPRHLDTALQTAPVYLKFILGEPVIWIGFAGCLMGLYALYERSLLPAALGGLGLVSFLGLGVAELPLLIRYLLLPGTMLAFFSAVATFGWLNLPRGGWLHRIWLAASAGLVLILVVSIPADRERIQNLRSWIAVRREAQIDLHDLTSRPNAKAWFRRCPDPLDVYTYRLVPLLAYWLERPPRSFGSSSEVPKRGLILSPATSVVAANLTLGLGESVPDLSHPKGFLAVSANRSWILYAKC